MPRHAIAERINCDYGLELVWTELTAADVIAQGNRRRIQAVGDPTIKNFRDPK